MSPNPVWNAPHPFGKWCERVEKAGEPTLTKKSSSSTQITMRKPFKPTAPDACPNPLKSDSPSVFPSFAAGERGLKRLAVHTITTKPWDIHTAIARFSAAGIGGISIWRDTLSGKNLAGVRMELIDADLQPVAVVRGGFYTGIDRATRDLAVDDNLRAIDEAAGIGAPMVVLVCGATPGISICENIEQIRDGIERTLDHASAAGVRLAIEPLHPMYADCRSAVATMKSANDLCEAIDHSHVGVAVDVFHVWWDPDLEREISRCGAAGNILGFHVCDWKLDMADMLNDRGLMGEGIIDVKGIGDLVDRAGFDGFYEVEVFSTKWWAMDQDAYLKKIVEAYREHC